MNIGILSWSVTKVHKNYWSRPILKSFEVLFEDRKKVENKPNRSSRTKGKKKYPFNSVH